MNYFLGKGSLPNFTFLLKSFFSTSICIVYTLVRNCNLSLVCMTILVLERDKEKERVFGYLTTSTHVAISTREPIEARMISASYNQLHGII